MVKVQKILIIMILVISLVIIFGTALAFVSGAGKLGKNLRKEDPAPAKLEKQYGGQEAIFSQIGNIRAATADSPPVPLVVSPYFPYPADDGAFYEELARKKQKIRSIIVTYFGTHTQKELFIVGEEAVKKNLIELINADLVLGKISVLYFSEYIFFE